MDVDGLVTRHLLQEGVDYTTESGLATGMVEVPAQTLYTYIYSNIYSGTGETITTIENYNSYLNSYNSCNRRPQTFNYMTPRSISFSNANFQINNIEILNDGKTMEITGILTDFSNNRAELVIIMDFSNLSISGYRISISVRATLLEGSAFNSQMYSIYFDVEDNIELQNLGHELQVHFTEPLNNLDTVDFRLLGALDFLDGARILFEADVRATTNPLPATLLIATFDVRDAPYFYYYCYNYYLFGDALKVDQRWDSNTNTFTVRFPFEFYYFGSYSGSDVTFTSVDISHVIKTEVEQ